MYPEVILTILHTIQLNLMHHSHSEQTNIIHFHYKETSHTNPKIKQNNHYITRNYTTQQKLEHKTTRNRDWLTWSACMTVRKAERVDSCAVKVESSPSKTHVDRG